MIGPFLPRRNGKPCARRFRYAYVHGQAIGCSREELNELEQIQPCEVHELGQKLQNLLGVRVHIPSLQAYCVGRKATREDLPLGIWKWLKADAGYGTWLREQRTMVAVFQDHVSIGHVLVHESTHALLDVLTGGFQYPLAIEEGFARRMEYIILPRGPKSPRDRGRGRNGCLVESEYMSIAELLRFDGRAHWPHDAKAFWRLTRSSFWLNTFLMLLSRDRRRLANILRELWQGGMTSEHAVSQWLAEVSMLTFDDLEARFHQYCIAGEVPQSDR